MFDESGDVPVLVSDSATKFTTDPTGAVIVTASHGGEYPAYLAAKMRVRAAVFNDAGVGKAGAGVAGLTYLDRLAIPAAAVSHTSARIGHGDDTLHRGGLSHVNKAAEALGCVVGMPCIEAVERLRTAAWSRPELPAASEARQTIIHNPIPVVLIDSASLVLPEDSGSIVVTGSHGGLLGGHAPSALKYDAVAAFYNDAGMGLDNAGISRLPALDARNIAGFTVSAQSARIGVAVSTYQEGIISAVNSAARRYGAEVGMKAREVIDQILQIKSVQHSPWQS
ncbi:MAG: hypothetical protein LUC93_12285 [Planctomycetaceae bacterium]|nr:hypothetical protein [Planctomycetaceae bacterium]